MSWVKPGRCEVMKAIDVYIPIAYPSHPPPKSVQARIDSLAGASDENLYQQSGFEADPSRPGERYAIRLGNRYYPHMKLIVEAAPTGNGHLFRADTHDQHVHPPAGSHDAELFSQMVIQNRSIAEEIEAAWEKAGLATFKSYLRHDLARRNAARAKPESNG